MCVFSRTASCGIIASLKSSGNQGMPASSRSAFRAFMPIGKPCCACTLREDPPTEGPDVSRGAMISAPMAAKMRAPDQMARNCVNFNFGNGQFRKSTERKTRRLRDYACGVRALDGNASQFAR